MKINGRRKHYQKFQPSITTAEASLSTKPPSFTFSTLKALAAAVARMRMAAACLSPHMLMAVRPRQDWALVSRETARRAGGRNRELGPEWLYAFRDRPAAGQPAASPAVQIPDAGTAESRETKVQPIFSPLRLITSF